MSGNTSRQNNFPGGEPTEGKNSNSNLQQAMTGLTLTNSLQQKIADLEQENASLKTRIAAADAALAALGPDFRECTHKDGDLEDDTSKAYAELAARIKDLQKAVDDARAATAAEVAKIASLEADIDHADGVVTMFASESMLFGEEIKELKGVVDEQRKRLEDKTAQLKEKTVKLEEKTTKLDRKETELANVRKSHAPLQKNYNQLKQDWKALKQENASLKQELDEIKQGFLDREPKDGSKKLAIPAKQAPVLAKDVAEIERLNRKVESLESTIQEQLKNLDILRHNHEINRHVAQALGEIRLRWLLKHSHPDDKHVAKANDLAHRGQLRLDLFLFAMGAIPVEYQPKFESFYKISFSSFIKQPDKLRELMVSNPSVQEQVAILQASMNGYGSFTPKTVSRVDDDLFKGYVEVINPLIRKARRAQINGESDAFEKLAQRPEVIETLANMRLVEQRTKYADKNRLKTTLLANIANSQAWNDAGAQSNW